MEQTSISTTTNKATKQTNQENAFIESLDEKHRKGLEIAKRMLGCSFSLEKCSLFLHTQSNKTTQQSNNPG